MLDFLLSSFSSSVGGPLMASEDYLLQERSGFWFFLCPAVTLSKHVLFCEATQNYEQPYVVYEAFYLLR